MRKEFYQENIDTVLTGKKVPQLKGTPIIGHLFPFLKNPPALIKKGYENIGPVFNLKVFNQCFTVMAGPEAIDFINEHDFEYFSNKEIWKHYIKEFGVEKNAFSIMDGPKLQALRKVKAKGYSIKSLEGRTEEVINLALKEMKLQGEKGILDVNPYTKNVITEQLGILLTGRVLGKVKDPMLHFLRIALNVHIFKIWPNFLLKSASFKKAKKEIMAFSEDVLNHHRTTKREVPNLIDDILEYSDNNPGALNKDELKLSVLSPFIAGIDTAANVLASSIHCLLKYPDAREKVEKEVNEFFENRIPTIADLRKMHNLRALIMETLRFNPLAPTIVRSAAKDFIFKGHIIPRGSRVLISLSSNHFDSKFFKNPEKFDLERFQSPRDEHKHKNAYSPYGVGGHTCLGNQIAESLMMLNVAALLKYSKITSNGKPVKFKYLPTVRPSDDFKAKIKLK